VLAGVPAVTFGPSELAQLMRGAQATIAVAMLSSASAGIVLGSIIACCNIIRAKRQRLRATGQQVARALAGEVSNYLSSQADITNDSGAGGLAGFPGGGGGGGPAPRRPPIFPVTLFAVTIVLAVGGGALYWHHTSSAPPAAPSAAALDTSKGSEFEGVYSQLGIRPLPSDVERQQPVQSRLAQLSREPCYRDAVIGLGGALLDAGYPREAAISLRTFVKRCGSASEVLPFAYSALEKLNDFSAALEVANELVEAVPADGTFRYWRALAYDRTGQFSLAMLDYMNTVELFGDPKTIFGDVFYKWSRTYAALGRYCDAISPIETYVSLDPPNRRTPQTVKIISDYAEKGNCNNRYGTGAARVSFAGTSDVRTLTVAVNGVAGNLILDTGATFVSITSQFARKAKVATEPGNQVIMKTVGGKALAEIGYAKSVSVGKAEALGVVTAVHRDDSNPFGNRVDGLLGMSFLSRFNIRLSPTAIELTAIPLR
jgi:tetratricopeptide (TPR) repeat protein